jgi:hypothetical protein
MTPKLDGFRALGVKHPEDLLTQVKETTKLNLMRQEIRLLSEKLKVINMTLFFFFFFFFFYFLFFFYVKVIPPISYPAASKILITDITDFKFHIPTDYVLVCL